MSLYEEYLREIETRKAEGLHPKPIEDGNLLDEIIDQIVGENNKNREASINFFVYNTLPGTTSAAAKSLILKEIILGSITVEEITKFAFELLSHMKEDHRSKLIDLAFDDNDNIALNAASFSKPRSFV